MPAINLSVWDVTGFLDHPTVRFVIYCVAYGTERPFSLVFLRHWFIFYFFPTGLMVQWWILSSSIRSSNVQSAPEWILQENVPCGHELPTYIPTIIIIITYHTVKLTITMARIVVYYYVLLVDFFKNTEKNEFYIPFTYVVIYFAFLHPY